MLVLHILWAWIGHALAAGLGIWALWRGGTAERLGALLLWFTWILTPIVQSERQGLDVGIALVDGLTMVGFFWLSFWSRKLWTAFAAAFMLLTVMGHLASVLSRDLSLFVYITANGFWGGYAMLGALGAGLISKTRKDACVSVTQGVDD